MVPPSLADDSYGRAPLARPIELGEVDALPCAERDVAFSHRERHGVAHENRLDVRGTVSFGVRVARVLRHSAFECCEEVFADVRVGVLVHEDRRGRVRDAHRDHAVPHLRSGNGRLHARRDLDGLLAHRARHRDLLVPDGHPDLPVAGALRVASRGRCPPDAELPARPTMRAIRAGVALPPLTTRTVFPPRRSTLPARTAASGAAPEGSTRSERRSRYW